jgi:hypothetical protein
MRIIVCFHLMNEVCSYQYRAAQERGRIHGDEPHSVAMQWPGEAAFRISMSSVRCGKSTCLPAISPCASRRDASRALLVGQGENILAGRFFGKGETMDT